ncbi:MAG: Flp pilus assembly complex ATPase component TadA [Aquiluna sp.]|nr:Flp pilus assembly complex ATPase component TadA [Aquiluna sp.]MCF8545960.1 Flp pilus assembly complex ATPase component TadA [Aquiluna sp.]
MTKFARLFPAALEGQFENPLVTDLLLDGFENTFIDCGNGLERAPNPFVSHGELAAFISDLAFEAGSRIDIAKPMADFMVGSLRFHAVLGHGVSPNPQLSVRRHVEQTVRLDHLLEVNMFDSSTKALLLELLESRANILISGPTSTGKTTLLSALIAELNERVICIEQTPELILRSPAVSLIERPPNQEGAGEISIQQLIVETLRMRPDRIVVGEVRGKEMAVLLQAMNNGHSGTLATLHARSLTEVAGRLVMLGHLSGLSKELVNQLVLGSVDYVIQLGREHGVRRISAIGKPNINNGILEVLSVAGIRAA